MKDAKPIEIPDTPFVNEVRLNGWQWLVTLVIAGAVVCLTPALWKKGERFETDADYRIPYALSKDYWLYERWIERSAESNAVFVVGDSVVWGEYVRADGTLSHFLNEASGQESRFINAGVNGLFPLALEGLIRYYGEGIRDKKVLLHCNVLWMSSPKVDLQTSKEEKFNHPRLAPQFRPWIPCYKAEVADRLGIVVERNLPFVAWVNHLQNAYFGRKNILAWTLADDGRDPPDYPNSYGNPLKQIAFAVPGEPVVDPERGPSSSRHRPWSTTGKGSARFNWVSLESSLQWGAFQRLVEVLKDRGNDVVVIVGPFNEHIMAEENRERFRLLVDGISEWLRKERVRFVFPEVLPSELYADASHPLTAGYSRLAQHLLDAEDFRNWVSGSDSE